MREIKFDKHDYGQVIPMSQLRISLEVQRTTIPGRVKKLRENWQEALCGEFLVFGPYYEGTGKNRQTYFLVGDGGHRKAAKADLGHSEATCEVFGGVSKEDQALVFLGRNDRAGIASSDRNRNLSTLQDEDTLIIGKAAVAHGFVFIANSPADVTFSDRAAGVAVIGDGARHGDGATHLAHVFEVYAALFGIAERVDGNVFRALSKVLVKVPDLDLKRFVTKFAGMPMQVVVSNAHYFRERQLAEGRSIGRTRGIAQYMGSVYDQGAGLTVKQRISNKL